MYSVVATAAPQVTHISPHQRSIQVSWIQPRRMCSNTVTRYTVRCSTNSATTRTHQVTVQGLQPFTSYQCCVRAYSTSRFLTSTCLSTQTQKGNYTSTKINHWTIKIISLFFTALPTSPKNVHALYPIHTTSITLSWSRPQNIYDDNSHLRYHVECPRGQSYYSTSSTSRTISGLYPGTHYTCCVVANNSVGSSTSACTTFKTRPGMV